jgi:hypothetical protein
LRGTPISVGNPFAFSGLSCLCRRSIADSMELSRRVAGINNLEVGLGDGFAGNGLGGPFRVSGGDLEGVEDEASALRLDSVFG